MIRKLLKIVGFGLVGLVVGSGGWIAYGSRDLPQVDDADLRIERPPVDAERNLRTHLDRRIERMAWDDDYAERVRRLVRAEDFDRSAASALLAQQREGLADLESLLRVPHFRIPPLRAEAPWDEVPRELHYRHLAWGLALRSRLAAEDGDAERAAHEAFLALDLGQRVERATGAGFVTVLTSRGIKKIGLDALDRASRIAGFEAEHSKELARRLDSYRAARQAWADMWAVEYEFISSMIIEELVGVPSDLPAWVPERYVFHPNRSMQMLADAYRARRRTAWAPTCADMDFPLGWDPGDPVQKLRVVLGPNSVGRLLFHAGGTPNMARMMLRRCQLDVEIGATQARLALRAWQSEHGSLPEDLEDLVPGYLDAVPVDAFDGRPLRYERQAGRMWSVGSDLRDRGGRLEEGEDPLREIVFPI